MHRPHRFLVYGELRTLRAQDTSDPGHFGTSLVGPKCPDRSALVPKCPKNGNVLAKALDLQHAGCEFNSRPGAVE